MRRIGVMNTSVSQWRASLSSAYPSAADPYWRALPLRRMKKLLMGAFFLAAGGGFAVDLLLLNRASLGYGLFWPVFVGTATTTIFVARAKRFRLALPLWLLMVALVGLAFRAAWLSAPLPDVSYRRVVFDVIGVWLGAGVGYRLFLSFLTTQGLESVRMHTELSLAHGIQTTLVPTISHQNERFEVFGESIPSTEMGGDVIDVIESDGSLLAYVADVSGHGLAAGQLMGMLKTAIRVSLHLRQDPVALLEGVDRVLPAVKEPQMYATVALLHFNGPTTAEYASAGHLPILHYRDRTRDTARLSMEQFPLGLFPGGPYASEVINYSSGDLFLMLTDGISDVTDDGEEEFGLARLEQVLMQHARQPLPRIWQLIMEKVRQHGSQQDDQSLLLVRIRE